MEITLTVKIPDQVLIKEVSPPTGEEWAKMVKNHISSGIGKAEASSKSIVGQASTIIATKSESEVQNYRDALDTLNNIVDAQRTLQEQGITVYTKQR